MGRPRHRVIARRRYICGKTADEVADELGITARSYRAFEAGSSMLHDGRLPRLREILGDWDPEEMRLAIEGDGEAVVPNGHSVPGWIDHLTSLEQGASELHAFEATTVHGLLQTAEYALAVEEADAVPRSPEDIALRVEVRMARQAVLDRQPNPLDLLVILDESVLRRVAGNAEVMRGQLTHLVAVADRPNVDVRILPLDAGTFVFGSFSLLTKEGSNSPYMACTEDRAGAHYLERPWDMAAHLAVFDHLVNIAYPPAESADLIRTILKEKYQ